MTRWRTHRLAYLPNRPRRKMSPVSSLGKVVDSHNPQRVEILERVSERASASSGTMQLLESRKQTCSVIFNPLHLCCARENTWFEARGWLLPKQIDQSFTIQAFLRLYSSDWAGVSFIVDTYYPGLPTHHLPQGRTVFYQSHVDNALIKNWQATNIWTCQMGNREVEGKLERS